jgi:hypothetical protein
MKRTQRKQPSTSGKDAIALDAARLNTAHGGVDIAARIEGPLASWVPSQHNELLVTQ